MKYVTGDIFKLAEQGLFHYVIHGCNCQNAMGSGIAKTVKERYPKAWAADMATQKGDLRKLGHFTHAYINSNGSYLDGNHQNGFTIINAYTQAVYWNQGEGVINLDYDALEMAFMGIKLAYDNNPMGNAKFAIPKIGAVRGGGDWNRIEKIIDSIGFGDLTCVIYDGEVNK